MASTVLVDRLGITTYCPPMKFWGRKKQAGNKAAG